MSLSTITFIIMGVVIFALVKECISTGALGILMLVAMILTHVLDAKTALGYFANSTVIEVACAYVISAAVLETGVADKIGLMVKHISVKRKNSERLVIALVMLMTIFVCLLLPRFATVAALMPIIISIAAATGVSRTKLLLVLALCAQFAGTNTLMSTPPNMLANGVLNDAGVTPFGFFEFAWIGAPLTIIGFIVIMLLEKKILPSRIVEKAAINQNADTNSGKKVSNYKAVITSIAFAIFVLGIMFENKTGIGGHVTALLAVGLLMATKVLDTKKVYSAISWSTVFFVAGTLALGKGLQTSGASKLITSLVMKILGNNPSPYLITAVLFIISALLTQFISSNTAVAGLLFPIGLSIAKTIGADPHAIIMTIVLGAGSSFMTSIATPSVTMVVEEGHLKFNDFVKAGAPLMLVTFILCMIIVPLKWPFF